MAKKSTRASGGKAGKKSSKPPKPEAAAESDDHVTAVELRMASFLLSRRLRAERADADLTEPQNSVLGYLATIDGTALGALAERERVSAPSMNRTVNALEAAGYVRRTPDPDDGRRVVIQVTEAGRAVVEETKRRRSEWLLAEISRMPARDRVALHRAAQLMLELARR